MCCKSVCHKVVCVHSSFILFSRDQSIWRHESKLLTVDSQETQCVDIINVVNFKSTFHCVLVSCGHWVYSSLYTIIHMLLCVCVLLCSIVHHLRQNWEFLLFSILILLLRVDWERPALSLLKPFSRGWAAYLELVSLSALWFTVLGVCLLGIAYILRSFRLLFSLP